MSEFIQSIMSVFNLKMTLYGFTFSFWDLFVFSALCSVVGYVIGKLFE